MFPFLLPGWWKENLLTGHREVEKVNKFKKMFQIYLHFLKAKKKQTNKEEINLFACHGNLVTRIIETVFLCYQGVFFNLQSEHSSQPKSW